jgi:hypothetical protein
LSFIRKYGPIALFFIAIFIVVEISFRFYVVGPLAFNPWRANSLNTLMRSEYVQLSEYPELFFELKPNMKGWFKGVKFATNSAGMVDREYEIEKPEDVFRVAVAGSSWTMASGVEPDQAWHAVLEQKLNGQPSDQKFDVLNFGVELYGLRESVGAVRHKAMAWDPDLIVVAVTTFTRMLLWEEPDVNQKLPDRAYPFFESFALRNLAGALGLSTENPADDRPRLQPDQTELLLSQLQRTLSELGEMSAANNVPVVIMFFGYVPLGPEIEHVIRQQASKLGITIIIANEIFPASQKERRKLQISYYDRHPNRAGHELIADFLGEALAQEGLLPE